MFPHFMKGIQNLDKIDRIQNHGIIRHLVAFYLWEYEEIDSEGLISNFFIHAKPVHTLALLTFLRRQDEYVKNLDEEKAKKAQQLILDLWSFLFEKYKHTNDEEELKILAFLPNLLEFGYVLNETITSYILISVPYIDKNYSTRTLIKNLIKQQSLGEPASTAKYFGQNIKYNTF